MGNDELKVRLDEVQEESDQDIDRPGGLRLDQDQQLAPGQQPQIVITIFRLAERKRGEDLRLTAQAAFSTFFGP